MSILSFGLQIIPAVMQTIETDGGNLLCRFHNHVAYCDTDGNVLRYSDEYTWDIAVEKWGKKIVEMEPFHQMQYYFEFEHNVHEFEYEEDRKLIIPFLYSQIGSEGYLKEIPTIKPETIKIRGINIDCIYISEIRTFSAWGFELH